MSAKKKPIALLTDDIPYAIHWAITNYKGQIEKVHVGRREIRLLNGQRLIVCDRPEQLLALEISDYKDTGGNKKPASHFIRMIEMAQTRMR